MLLNSAALVSSTNKSSKRHVSFITILEVVFHLVATVLALTKTPKITLLANSTDDPSFASWFVKLDIPIKNRP